MQSYVTLARIVLAENDWDLTKMKKQSRCKLSCDSTTVFSSVEVSQKVQAGFVLNGIRGVLQACPFLCTPSSGLLHITQS